MLTFLAQKTEILVKKWFFLAFLVKSFQKLEINQKSEKPFPRYTYLEALANFWSFLSKNIFLPLFWAKKKKVLGQKSLFGDFSKIGCLAKNLTI